MARKISNKIKRQAVQDYLSSGETLRVVSERNSMSVETLRKAVGNRVRSRGIGSIGSRRSDPETIQRVRIAYNKTSKAKAPNGFKRWSPSEDSLLRDAVYENMSVRETCKLLGRSRIAVYGRKHWLVNHGFIKEDTRFIRTVDPQSNILETTPVVETVFDSGVDGKLQYQKDHVVPMNRLPDINLESLAKLVKDYGVQVTVSYENDQMQVKIDSKI